MQRAFRLLRQPALSFLFVFLCAVDSVLAASGGPDPTFGAGGTFVADVGNDGLGDNARDMVIQSDGRIVVVGGDPSFTVARFNANGTPDTSFGSMGTGFVLLDVNGDTVSGYALVIQRDGKLVVFGSLWNGRNAVAIRLNSDGSMDSTFGTNGVTNLDIDPNAQDRLVTAVLQMDDKILAAGSSGTELLVVRLTTAGALDSSFSSGGVMKQAAGNGWGFNAITLQADGKIVGVGGSSGPFMIVRLNADGSFDNTFDADGIVMTNALGVMGATTGVAIQSDGRIVVGGYGSAPGSGFYNEVVLLRFNSNGVLDTCFGSGGIVVTDISPTDDEIYDLVLDSQDRIMVAGQAEDYIPPNSNINVLIARYTVDGDPDTTFGTNGAVVGDESTAWTLALQSDGKLVIGGYRTDNNAVRQLLVQRFLNDAPSAGAVPGRCQASGGSSGVGGSAGSSNNSSSDGGGGGGGSIDPILLVFAVILSAWVGDRRRRSR